MATVRFIYEMEINEEELREDLELDEDVEISENVVIDRAKTLFDYSIQDREIYASCFKCKII